jgi:hypothetical protein
LLLSIPQSDITRIGRMNQLRVTCWMTKGASFRLPTPRRRW